MTDSPDRRSSGDGRPPASAETGAEASTGADLATESGANPDADAKADADAEESVSYIPLLGDGRLLAILLASSIGVFGPNAAPPALPSIAAALSVSDARIGLVMSAFYLPSVVAVPASGVLADMYGRRHLVLGGLVVFGAAGTAIALVDSFAAVLALRAVQGVGFAGLTPLAITVIGDLYDGPEGTAAQGMRLGAHGVVGIAIPALAGALAVVAWQYPFVLYAAAFPVAVVVALYLPETADRVAGGERQGSVTAELREYWRAIRAEATPTLGLLLAGGFVVFLLKAAVITFVPLYAVQSFGQSAALAGGLLSLLGATRLVVSPLAGGVVARTSQKWALLAAVLAVSGGTALVAGAPTSAWLVVGVSAYGVGDALFHPVLNEVVTSLASAERRAGVVSGMNVLKLTGSWVGPIVFGLLLAGFGFPGLFGVAAVLGAGYAVVMTVAVRPVLT